MKPPKTPKSLKSSTSPITFKGHPVLIECDSLEAALNTFGEAQTLALLNEALKRQSILATSLLPTSPSSGSSEAITIGMTVILCYPLDHELRTKTKHGTNPKPLQPWLYNGSIGKVKALWDNEYDPSISTFPLFSGHGDIALVSFSGSPHKQWLDPVSVELLRPFDSKILNASLNSSLKGQGA